LKNLLKTHKRSFEVGIVEHCNLNCKGCAHFSPLSEKHFMDIATYSNDVQRLRDILDDLVKRIHIMGGEPLLHPKIDEFLKVTRIYFPKAKIKLVTNGALYKKMNESFWQSCRENKIIITPTRYQCDIDYNVFRKVARKNGVKFRYYYNFFRRTKKLDKYPLDAQGKQDVNTSFKRCKERCTTLRDGKLFTCPTAAYISIFNEYFDENFCVATDDYIDIYADINKTEILHRLAQPIPFCKYCKVREIERGLPWAISERKKSEWV